RVAFFFQAEDGIRVFHVTGVQTCALPIWCTVGTWVDAVAGPGRNNHPPTPGVGQCAPGTASRTSGPLGRTALPSTGRGTENCPRSGERRGGTASSCRAATGGASARHSTRT